jgi:hypothetical protein
MKLGLDQIYILYFRSLYSTIQKIIACRQNLQMQKSRLFWTFPKVDFCNRLILDQKSII